MKRITSIALIAAFATLLATGARAADPKFLDFNISLFSPTHISSSAVYSGHHGSAAVAYTSGYYGSGYGSGYGSTQYWGVNTYPAPVYNAPVYAPTYAAPTYPCYAPVPVYHHSHHEGWGHAPAIGLFTQVGFPGCHPITTVGVGIF